MPNKNKPSPVSRIVLTIGFIVASAAYAVWHNMRGEQIAVEKLASPSQQFKSANEALSQTLSQIEIQPAPTSSAPVPPKPRGQYVDGSYTGSSADAYYGTVQVKAVISGGKIADVQFLQYPSDRSTSRYINGQAMPLLTQEAIAAQSANVDGVSGATATSGAFIESLASALAKAK